jgi:hypothetical protein
MMTKKDYKKAADIVRNLRQLSHKSSLVDTNHHDASWMTQEAFVSFFRDDNPRFDVERFREACNDT